MFKNIKNKRSLELYNIAIECGYEKCGIISIDSTREYANHLDKRIDEYPESKSFYEYYYEFANMKKKYPWASSILICGYWYGKYRVPPELKHHYGRAYLMDARLNNNSDEYKTRIKLEEEMNKLGMRFQGDRLDDITCFRLCAQEAGLGIIRNNNFLYTEKGSWIYFDAWVIDEELELTHKIDIPHCPKNCDCCQQSCKTGTLCKANTMNPYTCTGFVSSLNIDNLKDNPIASQMKEWIYGCDDCQNACPFNFHTEETEEFPLLKEQVEYFLPESILISSEEELRENLQPKFWYIEQDEVWKFKINALNALNNRKDKADNYEDILEKVSSDPSKEVREMARWIKNNNK